MRSQCRVVTRYDIVVTVRVIRKLPNLLLKVLGIGFCVLMAQHFFNRGHGCAVGADPFWDAQNEWGIKCAEIGDHLLGITVIAISIAIIAVILVIIRDIIRESREDELRVTQPIWAVAVLGGGTGGWFVSTRLTGWTAPGDSGLISPSESVLEVLSSVAMFLMGAFFALLALTLLVNIWETLRS